MSKHSCILSAIALTLTCTSYSVSAENSIPLSNAQLDTVTAGHQISIQSRAYSTGSLNYAYTYAGTAYDVNIASGGAAGFAIACCGNSMATVTGTGNNNSSISVSLPYGFNIAIGVYTSFGGVEAD